MDKTERTKLLKNALNNRGITFFNTKMIEEMAELTQVLCKFNNVLDKLGDDNYGELIEGAQEELGHVLAFSEVLKGFFDEDIVEKEKDKRIERFKKYCKKNG
jgi:hypothetical protein